MHQIIDATQSLMTGKNRCEQETDDGMPNRGLGGALVEAMQEQDQDQEVDLICLRRRRTRNAAGAVAGMMAARRAAQQMSNMGTHDCTH